VRKPSLLAREDVIGGLGNSHHHVRRLDDGVDLVADLEAEIVDSLLVMQAVTMLPLTSMRTCAVVAPFLMSTILPGSALRAEILRGHPSGICERCRMAGSIALDPPRQ
jgi:hypothetical protein